MYANWCMCENSDNLWTLKIGILKVYTVKVTCRKSRWANYCITLTSNTNSWAMAMYQALYTKCWDIQQLNDWLEIPHTELPLVENVDNKNNKKCIFYGKK